MKIREKQMKKSISEVLESVVKSPCGVDVFIDNKRERYFDKISYSDNEFCIYSSDEFLRSESDMVISKSDMDKATIEDNFIKLTHNGQTLLLAVYRIQKSYLLNGDFGVPYVDC